MWQLAHTCAQPHSSQRSPTRSSPTPRARRHRPHLWTAISDSDQRPAPASRVQGCSTGTAERRNESGLRERAPNSVMNFGGRRKRYRKNTDITDDAGAPGHTIIAVSTPSLFPGYSCRGHRPSRGMRHRESRASPHARLESRLEPLEERDVAPALEPLLGTQEPLRLRDEKQVGVKEGGGGEIRLAKAPGAP